jgi:hypothetical protein
MSGDANVWAFGWDQLIGIGNFFSVFGAAIIGMFAVRNWREERIDARKFELAEEYLSIAYQAIDVFDYIRGPMGFVGEGASRKPQNENETEEEKQQRDSDYVPIERINSQRDFFDRVVKLRPSIKAVFGEEASGPLEIIIKQRNRIIFEARRLSWANSRFRFKDQSDFDKHHEKIDRSQSILWKDYIKAIDDKAVDPVDDDLEKMKRDALRIAGPLMDARFKKRSIVSFFSGNSSEKT